MARESAAPEQMRTRHRRERIFARTPGERAFDRCLFPFALSFVVSIVLGIIGRFRHRSPPHPQTESALTTPLSIPVPPPTPVWHLWLCFAIGLVLAALWVR